MNNISKKLEVTANILIIVVALLLGGVLIKRFIFTDVQESSQKKSPVIGQNITDAGINLATNQKNVLLILQVGCKYCTESATFYKKLIEQTKSKDIKIIAVLPQPKEDAEQYIKDLGISGIEVRQSQLESLNVGGTPTIIVTDNNGVISETWMGKLPPDVESEVLKKLTM